MPDDVRETLEPAIDIEATKVVDPPREICIVFSDGGLRVTDDALTPLDVQRFVLSAALTLTARLASRNAQTSQVLERVYGAFDPDVVKVMGALLGRISPPAPSQESPVATPVP